MNINAEQLKILLPWDSLVFTLKGMFTKDVKSPVRHHHFIDVPNDHQATLLLMPAWVEGEYIGVKQVIVCPGNNSRNLPGLSSNYILSCGSTGQPLMMLDGNELTARRTAAASAMASSYLSKANSCEMLMVGAGRMGRYLIPAHMSVRPIKKVRIWDRNYEASQKLAQELIEQGIDAISCGVDMLEDAVKQSDIVSCATMATSPIVLGDWLKPGSHLDLVGSFTPQMREADNRAMELGSIFVDTRAGALSESGDLIIPISEGVITEESIIADFFDLCTGNHRGRNDLDDSENAITVFKSVGDSLEDLAAAILAYETVSNK